MHAYLRWAQQRKSAFLSVLKELVECESPSGDRDAIGRCQELLAREIGGLGKPEILSGNHLRVSIGSTQAGKKLLVLGHADTVWPLGTLRQLPFRADRDRAFGPGILDMKAGLVVFLFALRLLNENRSLASRPIVWWVVGDEETGSATSRQLTETEARNSGAVLVLEPGTGLDGRLKTARKGVGLYVVEVQGRAAHAGVDFTAGASAILELARQIDALADLTDLRRGTTVNPGVIAGGTRTNVVAESARVEVDVRVSNRREAEKLDRRIRRFRPVDPRCKIQVRGGLNRPPMERSKAIGRLYQIAQTAARDLGLPLAESSTGGGSDGNFTAALGVPTLDGLGAVGEGAHAAHESILVEPTLQRIALLARLLELVP